MTNRERSLYIWYLGLEDLQSGVFLYFCFTCIISDFILLFLYTFFFFFVLYLCKYCADVLLHYSYFSTYISFMVHVMHSALY